MRLFHFRFFLHLMELCSNGLLLNPAFNDMHKQCVESLYEGTCKQCVI